VGSSGIASMEIEALAGLGDIIFEAGELNSSASTKSSDAIEVFIGDVGGVVMMGLVLV